MRKYFLAALLLTILSGCEKDFNDVIDVSTADYLVIGTSSFNTFRYVVGDSAITIFLRLDSSEDVRRVYCDIIASDDSKLNSEPLYLLDNGSPANGDQTAGDDRFTNRFLLSRQNPVGLYRINYYVTDKRDVTKLAVVQQFTYDNGQDNIAPVISNAVINPDTLVVTQATLLQTSVHVSDSNGLNDIENVYFVVHRPNGTTNNVQLAMFDDGDSQEHGDLISGDGIFSLIIQVDETNMKGTYRFEFNARDRGGLISNHIDYFVLIQ